MVLHTCIRCTVAARTWMAYLPKYRWKDLKQWMLHICRGHHVAFRDPCREHWRRWPSAMGGPNIFKKYLEIWTTRKVSKYMYVYYKYIFLIRHQQRWRPFFPRFSDREISRVFRFVCQTGHPEAAGLQHALRLACAQVSTWASWWSFLPSQSAVVGDILSSDLLYVSKVNFC